MTVRVITLGDGRQVTLGQYVRAVSAAKASPDATFDRGLCDRWPAKGSEIVREFFDGVVDRINRHLPQREDRQGPHKRLLRYLSHRGRRRCAWCGQPFRPTALWQRCCSADCAGAYSS